MRRVARGSEEQPHNFLSLQEAPTGKNKQSIKFHKPFSYPEVQQIKRDLGDHLEDSEKYTEAFLGLTLLYELTWRDVTYVLGLMLIPNSRDRVLGEGTAFGDEWLEGEARGKQEHEIALLPMGSQAVPIAEPDWDEHKEKGIWEQTHFINCIIEGLKRARTKPLNYAKLADIEQGEKEAPGRFLERLWEGLRRFTNIFPEKAEGETILKDKFLTQSALDMHHKLQKWVCGSNQSLEKLLQQAGSDSILQ